MVGSASGMTSRKIATAKGVSGNKSEAELRQAKAFQTLFSGGGSREDAEIVLSELVALTGFFRPPNYAEWIKNTGTPQGFELHCALQAARAEPIRAILNHLNMSDERMVALEKAAREARS